MPRAALPTQINHRPSRFNIPRGVCIRAADANIHRITNSNNNSNSNSKAGIRIIMATTIMVMAIGTEVTMAERTVVPIVGVADTHNHTREGSKSKTGRYRDRRMVKTSTPANEINK